MNNEALRTRGGASLRWGFAFLVVTGLAGSAQQTRAEDNGRVSNAYVACWIDNMGRMQCGGGGSPRPGPGPDPFAVYGHWWFVNQAIADAWTEDNNPFDEESDWSDVPGEEDSIGVLISLSLPLQEEEGGDPTRYTIIIAGGEIDGQPRCWVYDDGGVGGRGPGNLHPECCKTQELICGLMNRIFGIFGDILCPMSYCHSCAEECRDAVPVKGKPCHTCDPCGGSWILCHIFGSCG